MFCYIHYISAKNRLHESQKTVEMLSSSKYDEKDVPEMVLAQRDFIKKEVDYFGDECIKWNFILFFIFMLSLFCFAILRVLGHV